MYVLNPRLAADIFDNEYIIANLDTGLYYSVQGNAVSLLQALPFTDPAQPIGDIAKHQNNQSAAIADELTAIWAELLKDDIVRLDTSSTNAPNLDWKPADTYGAPKFNRYADMQDLLMLDPIHDVDEQGWAVKNEGEQTAA
jgi:hypothetical protein